MEYKQMKGDRLGGTDVPHQERTTHRTGMPFQQHPVTGTIRLSLCGRPTFLCGGELHNSAASSRDDIVSSCDRLVHLGCNAVLAPVSWELIEPREGDFDLTLVDALVLELGLALQRPQARCGIDDPALAADGMGLTGVPCPRRTIRRSAAKPTTIR